jgi:hypothetical protein
MELFKKSKVPAANKSANSNQELSPGGTKIIRNQYEREDIKGTSFLSEHEINNIQNHIEKYVGKIEKVFHEIISEKVHIDICLVNPTNNKNYYTLITMGMSTLPMKNPNKKCRFMELYICLP